MRSLWTEFLVRASSSSRRADWMLKLAGSTADATGAIAADATRTVKAERSVRFMVKAPW